MLAVGLLWTEDHANKNAVASVCHDCAMCMCVVAARSYDDCDVDQEPPKHTYSMP